MLAKDLEARKAICSVLPGGISTDEYAVSVTPANDSANTITLNFIADGYIGLEQSNAKLRENQKGRRRTGGLSTSVFSAIRDKSVAHNCDTKSHGFITSGRDVLGRRLIPNREPRMQPTERGRTTTNHAKSRGANT